jgi:hypothetical protein
MIRAAVSADDDYELGEVLRLLAGRRRIGRAG